MAELWDGKAVGFEKHIDNTVDVGPDEPFAGILGANPSQGARSPLLWNAAFAAHGSNSKMFPLDVNEENLAFLLEALDADDRFIGGAVAIPHKETIAAWLGDRLTETAKKIGAINCLFRGTDERLWGTNTDGEGALVCIESVFGPVKGQNVVQLGAGGAGKATAAFIGDAGANLTLCVRSQNKTADFAKRISSRLCLWDDKDEALRHATLLINATSVGSTAAGMASETPLESESFARVTADAECYDIIYDPSPTLFLTLASERGLKTEDGRGMNLEQAILGFGYAAEEPMGPLVTREAMEVAKLTLEG